MEKLVVIIDDTPEYGGRLATYLNGSRTFPYRAVVLSDVSEAETYIKNDGVYAILAGERSEKGALEAVIGTGTKLFRFREGREMHHPFSIERYGSAKEIERILTEKKKEKRKIPVIGFFSPGGGCEAELLSRKIAEKLGEGENILYLSAFPFGCYGRTATDGFSEVLYFLRQAEATQRMRLREILQHGEGMDFIGPVRWYTDLESVSKEDMVALFREEVWDTEYRAFFVAVGQFDRVGRTLLNCCDGILIPVWETEEGKRVQEEFRRQLKESGETKIYSGMREFFVTEPVGSMSAEALADAVKKGGEMIVGSQRGNP